jgi:hypothetical protein
MLRGLALLMNAVFPGSLLVVRGPVLAGTILLALAVAALSAGIIGTVIALPTLRAAGAGAYLLLAVAASLVIWFRIRPAADPAAWRRLHATAAAAWLRDDHTAALAAAGALTRQAPAEPGAWRLLALVAADRVVAANALRRAERLESVEG